MKHKAYFAEFGQSECVYFTTNETSHRQVFLYKNVVPMLYKYVSVYVKNLHLHRLYVI